MSCLLFIGKLLFLKFCNDKFYMAIAIKNSFSLKRQFLLDIYLYVIINIYIHVTVNIIVIIKIICNIKRDKNYIFFNINKYLLILFNKFLQ